MLREAFQGLLAAFDGAKFPDHKVAVRRRGENHADGHPGPAGGHRVKGPGRHKTYARPTLASATMRIYDALRLRHFLENTMVWVIHAIGAVHDMLPDTAGPHVHFLNRGGEPARHPTTARRVRD